MMMLSKFLYRSVQLSLICQFSVALKKTSLRGRIKCGQQFVNITESNQQVKM